MGRISKQVSACALVLLAAGCGGGGGSNIREVPFTSFSAVQPNTRVVMSGGISTTVTGTYVGTLPNITVQSVNAPVNDLAGVSTQKLTYDGNKTLSGMSFSTPSGSASFSRSGGTDWACNSGVCAAATSSGLALIIDGTVPVPNGWNYQTFGVWGQTTSSTAFQAGAISAGAVTPATAVPNVGNALFTGVANGFFVENVGGLPGIPAFMTASMSADVNFGTGNIAFSTTGSMQIPLNGTAAFSKPTLNMTGTLSYTPGSSSSFSGNVATSGMSGTATGRFYGPSAQEIGGIFHLGGFDGTLVGGFGGRRP